MPEFLGKLGGFITAVVASAAIVWIVGFAVSVAISFVMVLIRRPHEQ
jgi:hypothetical protein